MEPTDPTDEGARVPSSRLREVREAKQAAEARVAELEAQLQQGQADAARWQAERTVFRAGIADPEAVELVMFQYDRLPQDSRPETPGAWVQSWGDETPRWFQGYRGQPSAPPAPASEPTPAAEPAAPQGVQPQSSLPVPQPRTTTNAAPATQHTTTGAAAGGGGWTAEQIAAIREEAERTGDVTKLREVMPAILKSFRS